MQMDVKNTGGSLQVLGCIPNTSEQKEEFPLMSYVSAHMSAKEEGESEKLLDDIDKSTLELKAETDRCLEEISRRAEQRNSNKVGDAQKDNAEKEKGAVLDRLRLMEWKRNEQDRLNILSNRTKHKPSEIHTLPQKNETDMDYFSGTGGRNRKMKKKAKKEVTTISLEELGCREIAKAALPQQRVYHPPPPPPAVNAWTQKSGSELFADVSAHSLTVYGGEDDEKTLRLVIEESIRTAREEQDRIINLYQRTVEDQRPTTSTSCSNPNAPAVSSESGDAESQITTVTTVTTVAAGVLLWKEPPPVGDGTWNGATSSDPQQETAPGVGGDCSDSAESVLKNESFSHQKSDAQQRNRTRNFSEGRSKESGRDGWNSDSVDVKHMGKANFIKRDNYPYSRNNSRQLNRPNKHQEDRVNGEEDWKEGDSFEEGSRDSGRNFGNRLNNNQISRNRGGRGGGQGRNWNHNSSVNERYQGSVKESRYSRNNNRVAPTESHGEEENWDEGVSSVISPRSEQQEDWSETNTVKGTENESRSRNKNVESWSEPTAKKVENDEIENWDEMDVSNSVKVENNSVITKTVTTSWNDVETSNIPKEENRDNSKNGLENWNQIDTSDSSRNKNYANSRNKREVWNDSRGSKNEGLCNSRNEKSEDRNGPGFRRGNFYSRNGRSEDWHETNTSQVSKRDNYFNHQNGWRHGQGRKYSEDKVQEEKTEDWDETDGSDRTSQRSSSSYHGYQRKRGTGLQNKSRNFSDNWSKDGNQGSWNRRDENSRPFGKENYSGNRTYYRTRNYSENRLRNDDHVSDGSETSGSSKDPVHEKSSYKHQSDAHQQNQTSCRAETESASGNSGDHKVKEITTGHTTVVSSSTGTRLSDKVLHYLAKIKEEGEPVEEKHQSHIIDMQEKQYTGAQYQADDAAVSKKVYNENDLNNNSNNKSEGESMVALDTNQQHIEANQSEVYYEESIDEQHQAAMSQPALVGEVPVENQQTLEPIKEWVEEPSVESREYDYVQPHSYPENHQLDMCNGRNGEDLAKEESEANQVPIDNPSLMMPSVTERYVPNNFYTLMPPPSQLNAMMMALPSGMNMPMPGAPYGFSIPPPSVMVPGQVTQNMYQSGSHLSQDTSMKPNMAQEHIDQNLQQNSSMKQSQVMTSNVTSNLADNNMHSHPTMSGSHLPQSPIYHPSMGQVYTAYTGLPQSGPVHSNPLQVFITNSGLSQKPNINQSLPQNHHVTSANISHNPALSQPPNYNSTLTHPSYQHNSNGVVTNGPAMIDPQVQRLNSLKEGILKQVLSGNMTDPNQIAAAATVLNQLQPAPIPPSPLFMTASPQFYPGMNVSAIPNVNYTSSSMMSNGYCSGLLAVDTNGSSAPSVNGSPSPRSAAPVYGPNVSVPNTGTCSQVTQSHDGSYHPQMNPSRPVVMPSVVPQYVYQPMYNPQLYQNGGVPEQLSLLQQQMATLSMSQQQQQTQQPQTQTLPPHLQQQLQQPPPGFNV